MNYDLDAMTQGLQRGDLIVVAGRPAMGKTSIVLNLAEGGHDTAVCLFSLEMSKGSSPTACSRWRWIKQGGCAPAGCSRRNGRCWARASTAWATADLHRRQTQFGVLEMRSLCRRLMAEQGKELGLVIDYLQLMEGSGSDNRVQELSRTPDLKQMARELNVPVIALSQLSRGVESAPTNGRC